MLRHLLLRSDATFNPHHMEAFLASMLDARGDRHLSKGCHLLCNIDLTRSRGALPRTKRCRGASQAQKTDKKQARKVRSVKALTSHQARIKDLDTPNKNR